MKNIKTSKKTLVASTYRHPYSGLTTLVQALIDRTADSDISNYNAYLLRDFNLNTSMNRRSSVAQNYLDMLSSNSICTIITQPTRVANISSTIIDHVITNCSSHSILPGKIKSDLTDHYLGFCFINHPIKTKPSNKYFYRFMKNFNPETFVTN